MPRESKKNIAAKQTTLATLVANNPGMTIKAANEQLKVNGFKYRLSRRPASLVVRSSRTATLAAQERIRNALGIRMPMVPGVQVAYKNSSQS